MEKANPVFYFSGTGGCLNAARSICATLPEFTAVPVAAKNGVVTIDADAAGFVFPLYFSGLPRVAEAFIKDLQFERPCYLFAVIGCGSARSGYALREIDELLKKKGRSLSAGFYLEMPDNYIPMYDVNTKEESEKIYQNIPEKLNVIVEAIRSRKKLMEPSKGWMYHLIHPYFLHALKNYDKHFYADSGCNACGLCEKTCPMQNITLKDHKPVWQGHCEFCLACIHFCPQKSIQWKKGTQKRGRYHYKGITASDIAGQRME